MTVPNAQAASRLRCATNAMDRTIDVSDVRRTPQTPTLILPRLGGLLTDAYH